MRRRLLVSGLLALGGLAAAILVFLPPVAPSAGISTKEAGAAFLGLVILVVAVLGPDWRDWF
jgi:hypothetical protein